MSSKESKFIHDLGTPLSTLTLLVESVMSDLREKGPDFEEQVQSLESAGQLLEKVRELLQARRQELLSQQPPNSL